MVDKDRTTVELTATDKDHIEIIQGGTGAATIIGAIRLALRAYALEVSLQANAQQKALDERRQAIETRKQRAALNLIEDYAE